MIKRIWGSPLKISGFITWVLGGIGVFVFSVFAIGLLVIALLIGIGLYVADLLVDKRKTTLYNTYQWGLSSVYLIIVVCYIGKIQEHTTFIFPSVKRNAGIIFGMAGYPPLPTTYLWVKRVSLPDNGILITSTKAEDMPVWQHYEFRKGQTLDWNKFNFNTNYSYDCILKRSIIKAWLFKAPGDTSLIAERTIWQLSNQINAGRALSAYNAKDNIIVNSQNGKYLNLLNAGLSYLPQAIAKLDVNIVYLAGNNFTNLPQQLYHMPHLHDISIGNNPLVALPQDLYKLKSLHSLSFTATHMKDITTDFSQCDSLTDIDISSSKLTIFPERLNTIPHLQRLQLNDNAFSKLSFLDDHLRQLKHFYIYTNRLSSLKGIGQLTQLEELLAFDNQIDSIPDEIGKLHKLKKLELWDNPIRYISPQIKMLTCLKYLHMDDDHLSAADKLQLKRWLPNCFITYQTRANKRQ